MRNARRDDVGDDDDNESRVAEDRPNDDIANLDRNMMDDDNTVRYGSALNGVVRKTTIGRYWSIGWGQGTRSYGRSLSLSLSFFSLSLSSTKEGNEIAREQEERKKKMKKEDPTSGCMNESKVADGDFGVLCGFARTVRFSLRTSDRQTDYCSGSMQ